jgi:hypothetical protein
MPNDDWTLRCFCAEQSNINTEAIILSAMKEKNKKRQLTKQFAPLCRPTENVDLST